MSTTDSGIASLEAQMAFCRDAASKAIARGEAVDPEQDEYGHAASAAHADALRYMRMSAKLGLALSKLKGEHTNNIRIHKTETVRPLPAIDKPTGRMIPPNSAKFEAALKKFGAENFGWYWDDDDAENPAQTAPGQGDPLPLSQGSNTP